MKSEQRAERSERWGLREKKAKSGWLRALSVTGVLLWIVLPLALFGFVTMRTATTSVEPPRAAYVTVESATASTTRPIALGLQWDAGKILVAPSWSGVVQEVLVGEGDEIADGSPVVRIDGIIRRAVTTPFPFSRQMTTDDTGSDVSMLNDYLRAHGYSATEGRRFGWDTLVGVRAFAGDIGVPQSSSVTSFDPSWVIFLAGSGAVQEVDFKVGAPAPSPGDDIVTLKSSLVDAVLLESAPLSEDNSKDTTASVAPVEPTTKATEGEALVVNGETLALADDRQRVSPDSLGGLAAMVDDGSRSVVAVLRTEATPGQWVLPVPGVIVDPRGATCVKVRNDDGVLSVPVTVVGNADGRVVVSGNLKSADSIAIYPTSISVSCK